eukprot:CAMPEP_0183740618 /NCGR_PEP_ID=MMETSP0737-20130205/60113_1 /TAXON_ID=385413 /ORGANISM="Thalassiosira miniscula, Strain CCMP1093" /LENGTH=210 /DNA_ID=CAMNT_0025975739 /DNA_START=184 /DNA_END=816 /DNA_ORIENTATION=+
MILRLCCQSTLRTLPRHGAGRHSQQRLLLAAAQSRNYMGGAGEMKSRRDAIDDAVAAREQELWDRAQPRYDAIMERHVRLPTVDDDDEIIDSNDSKEERALNIRKKRLIYRSKQRGWLEVDLLLGTWASLHVPTLSSSELDEFETFVNLETIDIYNIITLRVDVPEELCGGKEGGEKSLVEKIQEWAKESPLGKADREKYVEVKTKNNLI